MVAVGHRTDVDEASCQPAEDTVAVTSAIKRVAAQVIPQGSLFAVL